MTDWDKEREKEAAAAEKKFATAANKVRRLIAETATGAENVEQVWRAISKLEDRTNAPELRHTEAGERANDVCRALRQLQREAIETGATVRRVKREEETAAFDRERREEWAGLTQYERDVRLRAKGVK